MQSGGIMQTVAVSRRPTMGEIRVKVRLKNMIDESRWRHGQLAAEKIRTYEADAMVDTGAVRCVVPAQVVQDLGVQIRGQRVAEYADGRKGAVGVTEPLIIEIMRRDTEEGALVLGDEVLIGQTALDKLDLHADCANQR